MLVQAPYLYRLEYHILRRKSSGYHYPIIQDCYGTCSPLHVGDIILSAYGSKDGPYEVTYVGSDSKGKYARVKEAPYIEEIKMLQDFQHINQATFPFHDDIIKILYNSSRYDYPDFFKDIVFVTAKGYIFSYYDVMQSEDVGEERWPLKKYLTGITDAAAVYTSCTNFKKGLDFFTKLIIPSQVQIGKYNNKLRFHINLDPNSGYYWV